MTHAQPPHPEGTQGEQPFSRVVYSLMRTRTLVAALACVVCMAVIMTYIAIIRNADPVTPDKRSIAALILVNLILLLTLFTIVIRRAMRLWASLKQGSVGSRLQTRIVAMFSLVTIVPTIIVSVASVVLFDYGIQSWFDDRVSTALEESIAVAEAYLSEHKEFIRGDAIAMAGDVDRDFEAGIASTEALRQIIEGQSALRSLTEAVVFKKDQVLAQTRLSFSLLFEQLPADLLARADHGEVVILFDDQEKVRALIKLKAMPDTYLMIGRLIDNKVITHMDSAHGSVQQYRRLKANISNIQIEFSIIFVLLALLLLFAAVWYGMVFASRIIVPITSLVNAAGRVRAGDFSVRLSEGHKDDEIGTLVRAFNRMTGELDRQRMDLVEANRQLDARRRFTEAVLSGVSAGVVALGRDKRISLANPVAANLLLVSLDVSLKGEDITRLVPEFEALLMRANEKATTQVQDDVTITRGDRSHVLHVRISVERLLDSIEGYIITFDDITALLVAQRNAAWADVARRVAHEIKNPLTPIQLSTERLRKKYLPMITSDTDNYVKYLDTIVRHVGDIGKIVEEFVTFARMPAPNIKSEDIVPLLKKVIFSEQTSHPDIHYELLCEEASIKLWCDEQQMSRMLLNLLKNAAEAFEGQEWDNKAITLHCEKAANTCSIRITDNGPGFPPDKINRVLEPYMTTRAQGTGLGLAIVKKIIDEHKAQLVLENLPDRGASVTIIFSLDCDKNVT